MFNSLKTYSVYFHKDAKEPLETIEVISSGFNVWAFIFTGVWCIYNKCWRALAFVAFIFFVVNSAGYLGYLNSVQVEVVSTIFAVWFGFEANSYKVESLESKGYSLYDVVSGFSEQDGIRRFYDRFVAKPAT
jgi:hypothetical protein